MLNIVHYEKNAIKITVKYHLSPVRTAISKNLQTINAGEDEEKRQPSCTAGRNVNWYNHYGEQYGDSLKKKLGIKLPYDPAIPLLGIYSEKTITQKDTCTPMFTEALFTIARTWKQSECPGTDE